MATNLTRSDLHRLIDELPEDELHAARRFLEYLRDATATTTADVDQSDAPLPEPRQQRIGEPWEPRGDPVLASLMAAPVDDEDLDPEEEAKMAAAWERLTQGTGSRVSAEELLQRIRE